MLSNNSASRALERARQRNIPTYHVSAKTEGDERLAAEKMVSLLKEHDVELLVLAGYMKKVPDTVLSLLPNRVVNIHPSLLPAFGGAGFYGMRVHEAVIARGCHYSGVSIHMVNPIFDEGQIILQKVVSIPPGCSPENLAELVLRLEYAYYWKVIKGFADGVLVPLKSEDPHRAVDCSAFLKGME